jgi:hypothetical protein
VTGNTLGGEQSKVKYFTREWWGGHDETATRTVVDRYHTYYMSIRDKLPPDLVLLHSQHTLHDAKLVSIRCNFAEKTVEMLLNGWDLGFQIRVRYQLRFSGLVSIDQYLWEEQHEDEVRWDPWLGDLGYWEFELVPDGVEMRMLFDSGAEVHVVFSGFSFEHTRAP